MNQPDDTSQHSTQSSRRLSRRQLLTGAAAGAGLLAVGRLDRLVAGAGAVEAATLPNPESTGIEHIVLVMMENRSFDHFLGWLPHANGKQAGLCTLPTIWDRLAAAGLDGRYYYSDLPFLALWGAKYLPIGRPFASFLTDCAAGTLPNVAFIDPRFEDENTGTSGDDHPHADIRNGEAFLDQMYRAVTTGPKWANTVLIVNFDEWGGFFDHVAPTAAPIPPADQAAGNQDGLRGFRVPSLIISPWSRRGAVSHTLYDHTSVLKLIEWRWGLAPLSVRDATANNPATALNFSSPSLAAPQAFVPAGPFGGVCGVPSPVPSTDEWAPLGPWRRATAGPSTNISAIAHLH